MKPKQLKRDWMAENLIKCFVKPFEAPIIALNQVMMQENFACAEPQKNETGLETNDVGPFSVAHNEDFMTLEIRESHN